MQTWYCQFIAVVLTTVCVLSFSACDSDYDKSEDKTTTSTTTTTTTTTTAKPTTTTTKKSTTTTKKKTTTTKRKTTTTKKKTTTTKKRTTTTTKQTIYNPSENPNWGWQGSGDYVATGLKVSNYAVLTATHTGNSNFIVHTYDEDGRTIGLINEIGNYRGQVLIDESGIYEIEIIADGNWNITASGLSTTNSTIFSGTGDSVTPIFNTSNRVWEISHMGQSNFIVHEYDVYDDRDGLVNEIGNYSGVVRSDLIGNCFFEILADGSWTIKPTN